MGRERGPGSMTRSIPCRPSFFVEAGKRERNDDAGSGRTSGVPSARSVELTKSAGFQKPSFNWKRHLCHAQCFEERAILGARAPQPILVARLETFATSRGRRKQAGTLVTRYGRSHSRLVGRDESAITRRRARGHAGRVLVKGQCVQVRYRERRRCSGRAMDGYGTLGGSALHSCSLLRRVKSSSRRCHEPQP